MPIKIVFIDRDGTIGGDGHFTPIRQFVPFAGSVAGIRALKMAGLQVFALTNQTKIAAGQLDEAALRRSLFKLGCSDAFICPHAENAGCTCRKPKTGLIGQAHLKYHFKNQEAVIIGDSYRADMQCADNAGFLAFMLQPVAEVLAGRMLSGTMLNVQIWQPLQLGFFGTINRKKRRGRQ